MGIVLFQFGFQALGQVDELGGILDRFFVVSLEYFFFLKFSAGQSYLGIGRSWKGSWRVL